MQNTQNARLHCFWILVLAELVGHWRDVHTVEIRSKTCSVTNKGSSGRIVCRFRVDLNLTKHDFFVRRANFNDTDKVSILDCTWLFYDKPECFVRPRYTFSEETLSNEVVVTISGIEEEHSGQYSCHVIPEDDLLVEYCIFKSDTEAKTEHPSTTETTEESATETTTVWKPEVNSDRAESNNTDSSGHDSNNVVIGVATGLTIVVLLAAIVVATWIYRKCWRSRGRPSDNRYVSRKLQKLT